MNRRMPGLIAGSGIVLLSLLAVPAQAQDPSPAAACGDLAADFEAVVLRNGGDASGASGEPSADALAGRAVPDVGGVMQPSAIGEGAGPDRAPPEAVADLSEDERRHLRDLVREAREAADRGDADACRQSLNEARTAAREAGIGATAGGGSAAGPDAVGGVGGAGTGDAASTGAGAINPGRTLGGPGGTPGAAPGIAAPGTAPGGAGGGMGGPGTGGGMGSSGAGGGAGAGGGPGG
ncbi:hypothetical protein [Azospirillum halopraeferens]|uniref:hypothetical protein n=1 Tax=Azospirillum halopraeferens TaxID=34010 RepID=UPI000404FA9D|nr:hypothetical protein [Azospirillum halopraeferens]